MKFAIGVFDYALAYLNVILALQGILRLTGTSGDAPTEFTLPIVALNITVAIFCGSAGTLAFFRD